MKEAIMPKVLKKLLLSFLCLLIFLFGTVPPVHAQNPWYFQTPYEWYIKVYDTDVSPPEQIFGERYTAAQVQWIIYSIIAIPFTLIVGQGNTDRAACFAGSLTGQGTDLENCIQGLRVGQNQPIENEYVAQRQQINKKPLYKAVFAERPLSGIAYVKELARKFKLIPEVQAQGFGFLTALSPFREIWRTSRDVSYGFFVIVAIILAFMVMLRIKISPQTAVTIQSAIPKLIITLILVTFSYAIAGFLVDLMYVAIGIGSLIGSEYLNQLGFTGIDPTRVFTYLTTGSNNSGWLGIFLHYLFIFIITFVVTFIASINTIGYVALGIGLIITPPILWGIILFLLLFLVLLLFIAIIFILVRTVFSFIKAFVNIIILTIFAPFIIVAGVFMPSAGFGTWVKEFVANLAVFVIGALLVLFSFTFLVLAFGQRMPTFLVTLIQGLWGGGTGVASAGLNIPPSVDGWPPLIGVGVDWLYLLLSLVVLAMIPKSAEITKSLISGRPFGVGTAIGEALAPSRAGVGIASALEANWWAGRRKAGLVAGSKEQLIHSLFDISRAVSNKKISP